MKLALIKTITNNKVVVICPHCGKQHEYKRNHTDEGKYIQQCPNVTCEKRYKYIVDREVIFK